jgi:2-keto-3-deoxy-L-rhamnonate aldolase RhmA
MDGKELKAVWHSGKPSFGAWITGSDPSIVAAVCNAGYEWVFVDGEHCPYGPEQLREVINTIRARDVVPIVRVADNQAWMVKQVLDLGAEGVVVPLLMTADDARRAVAACRYPPRGMRGFNPRDATNCFADLDDYCKTIDERVVAVVQVEHATAVENLDAILATPGIDAVLIGPADLSYSLGYPRQPRHPAVEAAIVTTIHKCNAAGVPVGITVMGGPDDFRYWLSQGLTYITLGFDFDWVTQGGRRVLEEMRATTGGR